MRKSRPQPIAEVLAELMARRGYQREQATGQWADVWQQAVGPMVAGYSRVGNVRRGVLEVIVANSTLVQELTFQKVEILAKLRACLPQEEVTDIRLRVGPIE